MDLLGTHSFLYCLFHLYIFFKRIGVVLTFEDFYCVILTVSSKICAPSDGETNYKNNKVIMMMHRMVLNVVAKILKIYNYWT